MKPLLFATNYAPPYRVGAFERLHALEHVEYVLFGGSLKHGGGSDATELPFPHRHVREHELYALATSGRYRAVVCPTTGRLASLAAWAGAREARMPVIVWASLWAHPRSFAHAFSYLPVSRLYRSAEAVVTSGPHVSAYVRSHGARNVHEAPQAVDNDFWGADEVAPPTSSDWPGAAKVKFLFAGRPTREKGLGVLVEAWSMTGLQAPTAALVLVGAGSTPPWVPPGGAVMARSAASPSSSPATPPTISPSSSRASSQGSLVALEPVGPHELRSMYAAASVLIVPSIRTRTFREPWGLVVNEAMSQGLPVITTSEVGAAAGGLVRNEHNGLIVPAGDARALSGAIARLAGDAELRTRLGEHARADVAAYSQAAWAEGFSRALASVGVSRERVR